MMTEQKVDAQYITRKLYYHFTAQNKVACHNTFFGSFESDFIFMTNSGYITEIEVKISRGDYANDFKKEKSVWIPDDERQDPEEWTRMINRHDQLKNGKTGYKRFYFAMPEELAESVAGEQRAGAIQLPEHCGLLSVGRWVRTLVKAPLLPRAKKFEDSDYIKIMEPHYHKSIRRIWRGGSL